MLRKLLKYDLMSVWKSGWLTLPILIAAGIMAVICTNTMKKAEYFSGQYASALALIAISFLVGLACVVIMEVLVWVRFYKNFFTDEGYLTFTLPVKRSTLLLSKTINAVIWSVLYVGLFCFFGLLSVIIGESDFFSMLARELGDLNAVAAGELLVALSSGFMSIVAAQYAISVGATVAKKAKVICAIGVFYLVSIIVSMLVPESYLVNYVGTLAPGMSVAAQESVILVMYVISFLMNVAAALVLYFMTLGRLSRKLNLE